MKAARWVTIAAHLLGVGAFAFPFFLGGGSGGEAASHATDAPWLFTLLGTVLVAVAIADMRAKRMDAKQIALLGVLSAINAVLRLPGSLGGASLMFVLPIMAGYAFGPRFAFMLGSTSFAASAVITGGVGPWLPFQMWALGWVGAGAGLLPGRGRMPSIPSLAILTVYGWIAGFAFGAVMNLWSWPFTAGQSPLAWHPGLGPAETAVRYWRYYLVTSFAWDAGRALGNALLLATLGRPALRVMIRFRQRLSSEWQPEPVPAPAGSMALR